MAIEATITTIDNPFDPFEQFDSWFLFDCEKGYDTCGKLMRIAKISEDMSSVEYDKAIEDYTKAIALDNENIMYYNNRAGAYYKKENYKEAVNDYQ